MEENASQEIPSEIENNYYIAECLTPQKTLKTFVAFPKDSWVSVIVKEVSEKAFEIYKQISIITNTAVLESGGSHIARILELIQADGRCFVITESTGSESLAEYVRNNGRKLSERDAIQVCLQICDAIQEVHNKKIIHRDLKPCHVMIDEQLSTSVQDAKVQLETSLPASGKIVSQKDNSPFIKIIDFGEAFDLNNGNPHNKIGTPGYQAPEAQKNQVSFRTDIYSMGCVLNFMLTGYEPGVIRYRGNRELERIIAKTLDVDPFYRFGTVKELKRQLLLFLNKNEKPLYGVFTRIPGFRSLTWWKMIIASLYYIGFIASLISSFHIKDYLECFREIIFWFILPIAVCFDLTGAVGNIEKKMHIGPVVSMALKAAFVIICFLMGILADDIILFLYRAIIR